MQDGWLVSAERRALAPDRYWSGHKPSQIWPVEALVWHFTGPGTGAGARHWLTTADNVPVSAHFVIDRDGATWQLVPVTERAFHAGGNTSRLYGQGNVNGRTLGIELVNNGPLTPRRSPEGWLDALGRPYAGPVGFDERQRAWEPFDERQIVAACSLATMLAELYPQIATEPEKRNVGHATVDPTRKVDPGPLFPWPRIVAACARVRAAAGRKT